MPEASNDPLAPPMDQLQDYVLDTNAVRSLGELSDGEWRVVREAWTTRGCTTAWVPHVLGELLATNLARKEALDNAGLRAVQLAVRRMDALARGLIWDTPEDLIRRSIYALAEEPVPASTTPRVQWREAIGLFLNAKSPQQIATTRTDTAVRAIIKDASLREGIEVVSPLGFENHVRKKVAAMASRLGHSGPVARSQLIEDVIGDVPKVLAAMGSSLRVPAAVLRRALDARGLLLGAPFGYRVLSETVYYHHRATRRKAKIRQNDAADLAVATYLACAGVLVTDDGDLARLLRDVVRSRAAICSFHDWCETLKS